jgi:hypothetical protein
MTLERMTSRFVAEPMGRGLHLLMELGMGQKLTTTALNSAVWANPGPSGGQILGRVVSVLRIAAVDALTGREPAAEGIRLSPRSIP